MNAISFKNFRNFEELPLLKFGKGVTFLVGQNNAGKSTLTKACRLMAENMPSCIKTDDSSGFYRATIDFGKLCHSFKRALRMGADNQKMEFTVQTGYFTITYIIDGVVKDGQDTRGNVSLIKIYDQIDDCTWISDFEKQDATLEYNGRLLANIIHQDLFMRGELHKISERQRLLNDEKELNKMFEEVKSKHSTLTITEFKDKLSLKVEEDQRYQKWIDELSKDERLRSINLVSDSDYSALSPFECNDLDLIWIDENGKEVHDLQYMNEYMRGHRIKLVFNINDEIKHDMLVFDVQPLLSKIRQDYRKAISNQVIYLPAHETPQRSEFYIGGENLDYFETIVRDFYYEEGLGERKIWVSNRMKELGIGTGLVLQSQLGEVVGIFVKKEDGTELPFADLGRGTIQIIMLLLSIAAKMPADYFDPNLQQILYENPMDYASSLPDQKDELSRQQALLHERTIIIEEPEQNLHPALQSKLADLFLHISEYFRRRVIVETHSEYMIRKSQIQVAAMKFASQEKLDKTNPIHTYYFPVDKNPFIMQYRVDGSFENDFGQGFYDEASNLTFEIL
ncbi:MAG: AAA family ATPase [Paludibacteraceae bacterium]|nr:AAA family ATPase [Paludibacteraceae bacterium]